MTPGILATLSAWAPALWLLVGYLTGGNTFPHPLSEEEEAHFLQRLSGGDEVAQVSRLELS